MLATMHSLMVFVGLHKTSCSLYSGYWHSVLPIQTVLSIFTNIMWFKTILDPPGGGFAATGVDTVAISEWLNDAYNYILSKRNCVSKIFISVLLVLTV